MFGHMLWANLAFIFLPHYCDLTRAPIHDVQQGFGSVSWLQLFSVYTLVLNATIATCLSQYHHPTKLAVQIETICRLSQWIYASNE